MGKIIGLGNKHMLFLQQLFVMIKKIVIYMLVGQDQSMTRGYGKIQ